MSVVLCILLAGLGAALGAAWPQDLDESVARRRAPAIRGGLAGAFWGGFAGIHLGRLIGFGELIAALRMLLWPVLILGALAAFGVLARRLARRGDGAAASWSGTLAATLGLLVVIVFFMCVAIAIPGAEPSGDGSPAHVPGAGEVEHILRFWMIFAGGLAGMSLLMLALWKEFATMVAGGSLGQFLGGAAASLLLDHEPLSRAGQAGLAAAAGGLCTSFEWGLAGAVFGASIGVLFLVVWLLMPDIGEASDALPSRDDLPDLVQMPGVGLVKAIGGFGKLADQDGPFQVVAGLMAMFAFLGVVLGFVVGPLFGGGILRSLALVS